MRIKNNNNKEGRWLYNFVNMLKITKLQTFEEVEFIVCELYHNKKVTRLQKLLVIPHFLSVNLTF